MKICPFQSRHVGDVDCAKEDCALYNWEGEVGECSIKTGMLALPKIYKMLDRIQAVLHADAGVLPRR